MLWEMAEALASNISSSMETLCSGGVAAALILSNRDNM